MVPNVLNSFIESILKKLDTEDRWSWKTCEKLLEVRMRWVGELEHNFANTNCNWDWAQHTERKIKWQVLENESALGYRVA